MFFFVTRTRLNLRPRVWRYSRRYLARRPTDVAGPVSVPCWRALAAHLATLSVRPFGSAVPSACCSLCLSRFLGLTTPALHCTTPTTAGHFAVACSPVLFGIPLLCLLFPSTPISLLSANFTQVTNNGSSRSLSGYEGPSLCFFSPFVLSCTAMLKWTVVDDFVGPAARRPVGLFYADLTTDDDTTLV